MGVYYTLVCDSLRECIDPGCVDGCGRKLAEIARNDHPFGTLSVFVMVMLWGGAHARVVDDTDDTRYRDITEEAIEAYNVFRRDAVGFSPLRFTPNGGVGR